MIKPKPLQYYENINGEPGNRIISGAATTLFEYDISIGKKLTVFIHNPNHNTSCKISELFINDSNIKFHAKARLMPLETCKAFIEIAAMGEDEINQLVTLDEYTEDKRIRIEGEITWEQLGINWGDGNQLYGW